MTAGDICTKNVVVTRKEETIVDAAKRMRMFHVGDLVVVERVGERQRPIGTLTDRDIVLSVVASGVTITVTQGVVVVDGTVVSAWAKNQACEEPRKIFGVTSVTCNISVP